jgi:hypothetical protein
MTSINQFAIIKTLAIKLLKNLFVLIRKNIVMTLSLATLIAIAAMIYYFLKRSSIN